MNRQLKRRDFLKSTVLGSLALGPMVLAGPKAKQTRPNIVMFVSDDHGYLDSATYGSKVVKTPNMDRIAGHGMKFAHTFVGSPTCVPSRAILLTGLYSARNGAEPNHSTIRADVQTLPDYFHDLGYDTVSCGKSHFNPRKKYPFEYIKSSIRKGPLNTDLDTAAVQKFLKDRKSERPLFMIVGSHSPHVYWPDNEGYTPDNVELPPTFVDTPETRNYRTQYYTDVTLMDKRLGEVYDSVKKHLSDNTLFIYTTDHGAQWPFGKWNLYDAGIRVPMLAVWPGKIEPASNSDAFVSFADFLPTFLELAGGRVPRKLDGKSFAGLLKGQTTSHRNEIYATHSGDGNMNVYPIRCLRSRTHKYILNLYPDFIYTTHIDKGKNADGLEFWHSWEKAALTDPKAKAIVNRYHNRPKEELYDILADPHETNNIASLPENRKILEKMRRKVKSWMKSQGDQGKYFGTPRTK